MNIQKDFQLNFGAKISQPVYAQLYKEARQSENPKKLTKLLDEKVEMVKGWGRPETEIAVCQNAKGKYALGLRRVNKDNSVTSFPLLRTLGKSELSQFLKLRKENFEATENTLAAIYARQQRKLHKMSMQYANDVLNQLFNIQGK